MTSYSVLDGTKTWTDALNNGDSDKKEKYDHTVTMKDWKEHEVSYLLGLPVGIQFQYPIYRMPKVTHRNTMMRLYGDLGVKVNYVLGQKYNLVSGSIQHSGYYDKWNLNIPSNALIGHEFYEEKVGDQAWSKSKKSLDISNFSADAMADLGVMIPVREDLDVMVGVYANYTMNNLKDGKGQEIGWRNENSEFEHTFMNKYDGIVGTDYVKSVRPWDIGVKVGIQWHQLPKKPKKVENFTVCDTTMQLTRREEVEERVAAKKINDIMKKSVIWFDFDSDKPKLQPADVIDKIADVLKQYPDQMVLVYGHASKEGSMEYNQNLSERRAASIVRLLKKKGIPSSQMTSKGFSYTQQYDDSENPFHNIALDRRVEIIPVFEEDRIKE